MRILIFITRSTTRLIMFRQAKRHTAGRRNFERGSDKPTDSDFYKLSFYTLPPTLEITLDQFESYAIDRLKILIEIESCTLRNKLLKEIESVIRSMLFSDPLQDLYSHYILRLVFCRTEDLRRKFIKNELILFKIRYSALSPSDQQEFVKRENSLWDYISSEEKSELFESLLAASSSVIRSHLAIESGLLDFLLTADQLRQVISKENFIKLPFERVPSLVSSRGVLIRDGFAYIPTTLQLSLLAVEFQEGLSAALLRTFQTLPRLDEDDRLLPLLNNLSHNFSNIQYQPLETDPSLISDINANSIMSLLINKHFPLCATHLQKSLHINSHLKYSGRQQLGIFLKGIGLSVDEALKYWSAEFTKNNNLSVEKFNKDYKYNIRHQYGLEGARINYKPWDCATILSKPKPSKSDSHGCPYRDLNPDSLIQSLNDMGITDLHDINGVMDDVSKRDYTVACTRVFELTHKKQLKSNKNDEGMHINHPNLYFDRSRQLERNEGKTTVEA